MARKGGALKLIGNFAQGYLQGMEMNRKRKLEDEDRKDKKAEHELAMQHAQLENEKLESDKKMRDELGRLEQDTKPHPAFVVETPDGRTVWTDEKSAAEHADAVGAQVQHGFMLGGKMYADKEEAQVAADQANSPAVKMRMKADIYAKHGREDLAASAMQNYKMLLDNSRREMQQDFLSARATGNVQAVVDAYNKQLPNGVTAQVVKGQDGSPMVQLTKGGKPVNQPQPFNWDLMERQVMTTPDNFVEMWRARQGDQQVANDTARTGATVSESKARVGLIGAQTADIPLQARDRATSAAASATSAGAAVTNANTAATNAQTTRLGLTQPKISAVPDAKGGLNFVAVPQTVDATGHWQIGTPQASPAKGLQYPAGYVASQRNALPGFGGAAPGTTQVDPAVVESVLTRMQAEAQRRAALRNAGPTSSGVVQ